MEAPVNKVAGLLLDLRPGRVTKDNGFLIYHAYLPLWQGREVEVKGGPEHFTAAVGRSDGKGDITIDVDRANNTFASQGNWWYRGVHTIQPYKNGSLVVHQVYNIAPGAGRWAVPLMQWRFESQLRNSLGALLKATGEVLHCKAEVLR
ncbi:MAG: hypothetical protein AUI10_07085 [Actinobacteria bacterium 13_2_20CM_2_72_6]|nr:MAG: hypothetical protein AUI10_07085 [Actinobacteria bacterium 13_2_20CM_2_72_6]